MEPLTIKLRLDAETAELLQLHKPRSLPLATFCTLLIEQEVEKLDTGRRLPAYRVGAGTSSYLPTKEERINEASTSALASSDLPSEEFETDLIVMGDGVGRESEGGPRKDPSRKPAVRAVRPNLEPFADLIQDFWKIKGGSKNDRAWSLLQTELTKLQKAHGDEVTRHQIELAINGKWKGITEANFTRFSAPKGNAFAQPEFKHPAAREFRNGRFVDEDGPTTNPVLKELF
jgi:hypothetical protein